MDLPLKRLAGSLDGIEHNPDELLQRHKHLDLTEIKHQINMNTGIHM